VTFEIEEIFFRYSLSLWWWRNYLILNGNQDTF
jgi:hypothetical protein